MLRWQGVQVGVVVDQLSRRQCVLTVGEVVSQVDRRQRPRPQGNRADQHRCDRQADGEPNTRGIVTVFPDSGSRYLSTIYNDEWMSRHGFA